MNVEINYTTGYAGTGKSTDLIKKVKTLNIDTTVVIAPTHKALNRLRGSIDEKQEIKTIHSLLGWIPTINENAKRVEHIDSTHKLKLPLDSYTDIVIDEAGMMSEEMLFDIISKFDMLGYDAEGNIDNPELANATVTLHLYLDLYQLLPVKGVQIQIDEDATKRLETQYRSESPDVVDLYTKFVHYLDGTNSSIEMPLNRHSIYSENIKQFNTNEFRKGDRLLAYTNKAVGAWNKHLAKKLGITGFDNQEVQLGSMVDTVIVHSFIEYNSTEDIVADFKSGRLKLQNAQISTKFLEYSLSALIKHPKIKFIVSNKNIVYPVIVGIAEANKIMKAAKEKAIEDRKQFKHVYTLGRAYTMDYTFATTVHKSQGSEFNNVFVDAKDIALSILHNYYDTYARLMYVSISRCIKTLYI